ncbi:hypothetical protein [Actinophytocola sp.]|uniref:hypothetical protein n=1 Tax=Actinophytocola sp. TaxID=1872138 RepID=UPI003D6A0D92
MSKNLFDDAIGEVPPSTVDVDAVIARGRRADRMRRVVSPTLATVVAVATLLGGVAVVVLSDDDAGGSAPASPPSTTTAPPSSDPVSESPCAGMTPTAPPQPEEPAVTEDRLTSVLNDVVSDQLGPGATLEENPDAKNRAGKRLGALEAYHWYSKLKETKNGCRGGEDYYLARASVRSADGTGSVLVLVARAGGMGSSPDIFECDAPNVEKPDETSCETETTPNGDLVMRTGLGAGGEAKGSRTLRVDVLRADQTFVLVESANMATSGKYPGPATASKIPLSHEQLKQIALDPRVTMYPEG